MKDAQPHAHGHDPHEAEAEELASAAEKAAERARAHKYYSVSLLVGNYWLYQLAILASAVPIWAILVPMNSTSFFCKN